MPDIAGDLSLQSAEHAAACQQVRNSPGRLHVCPPCGIRFPNAKHLEEHATHPKHAAQSAWLAGATPAAILAAARGAAVARAAAAAGKADAKREADQKQSAAQPAAAQQAATTPPALQQPAQPQLPRLSTAPAAEGAQPKAAAGPSSEAAGSGPTPAAEAARPAAPATVHWCRVCGIDQGLQLSHFLVSASGRRHASNRSNQAMSCLLLAAWRFPRLGWLCWLQFTSVGLFSTSFGSCRAQSMAATATLLGPPADSCAQSVARRPVLLSQ
jgi:hypothetical protein